MSSKKPKKPKRTQLEAPPTMGEPTSGVGYGGQVEADAKGGYGNNITPIEVRTET